MRSVEHLIKELLILRVGYGRMLARKLSLLGNAMQFNLFGAEGIFVGAILLWLGIAVKKDVNMCNTSLAGGLTFGMCAAAVVLIIAGIVTVIIGSE